MSNPLAFKSGYIYAYCPACNRPPHEERLNLRCKRCGGFGYLVVKDRRFQIQPKARSGG